MEHPFLDPAFEVKWSQLTASAVEADIRKALDDAQVKLDRIAARSNEELSFENSLLALEEATEQLNVAWTKVGHLESVMNSDELRKAYNAMLPKVTEFFARIPLNDELWRVVREFSASIEAATLTGIRKRLLDETLADFKEAGADLAPGDKRRFEEIQNELSALTQKFSENVLDATNAFELVVDDESRLAGLPKGAKEQARESALSKGHGTEDAPKWRFTLQIPSFLPVLQYCEDADLRQQLYTAYNALGSEDPFDNSELIWKIVKLRDEKAKLLGEQHFADHAIKRRMAKSGEASLAFVDDLHAKIASQFARENEELNRYAEKLGLGKDGTIEPWDATFVAERMRREHYDFDEEELRPYFPINRVIPGMFAIAEALFGVTIAEVDSYAREANEPERDGAFEVWHKDVSFYRLHDKANGEHLGSFYADWFPRESKRGGAWMNYILTGGPRGDERKPHLGLICGNLTPSSGGKPALLTHREVETIFHEFGHLLHHLLGDVEIRSLNGVNVAWDFVELPSQLLENWCWDRESLDHFARHVDTGEPIPEPLFQKMVAARNFLSARMTMRQLSFAKLDLELHTNLADYLGRDLDSVAEEILDGFQPVYASRVKPILYHFSHLFSSPTGYAAGYYSYKWAEVLDADAFTRFQKDGILNSDTGREFREKILSKGNSEEPDQLFRDFMGRDPDETALLKRSGLVA